MPRFNMNWLYITVLMVLLFVFFFSDGNTAGGNSISKPVGYSEFQQMVTKGYASKIVANKDESKLKMFVKAEHIREVFNKGTDQTGKEPYVIVEIGSVDQVETFINAEREAGHFTGTFSYENKQGNELWYSSMGIDLRCVDIPDEKDVRWWRFRW